MERDRRRFTPDGRPRAEPGEAGEGRPAPAEPRSPEEAGREEIGSEETGSAETGAAGPRPSGPPPVEPAARPPKPEAPADSKPQPPPAATEEPAPPKTRAGNEGREHLVGFLLTLADTYLRVIAARAAEPVPGADGAGANRGDRAGPDPLAQAFVGLEQVVSYFRLLAEPAGPGAAAGSPDEEEAPAGDAPGDPRLGQLAQLLLAHADFSLRAAAAPPAADPAGDGGPDPEDAAAAALRGAEALGAFQEVIGMLEALERHTRSRRTEEESRMMSRALYRMRMDYLALAGAPGGAPAGR